jgi:urocanate hydratase
MAKHVEAMVGFMDAGAEVFDYGNSIRDEARKAGYDRAFEFPGFVPAYIRPLFCEGKGPFRWAALSGDPADIAPTDEAVLDLFPDNDHLHTLDQAAQEQRGLPGPAGPDLLARATASATWPASGSTRWSPRASCPHRSSSAATTSTRASVASPYRETEAMADGSDAIADWPLLNALVNTAVGATWVSIHHGGGVGMGRSIHAGQVSVADGTDLAGRSSSGC